MSHAADRLATALADRYSIEREVGQGGMATVYLAQDLKHDRKVAVKVLRPELAAVIGADRFLSEIKTTANLQHPHILPLHDSGEADGFLFYVMPFVEGETVRDRLNKEKQLPVADAVRIATEVAAALDYAHRHNVIHRDIKPENILLHDGSALVADFGIALAASKAGGTRMTETGMSLGTPHYMSPEQAMGEREITARSDVYALGCVLYEMLTGDPPFTGSTAQAVVARVVTETPRPMTPQRRTIPPHVEAAVLTALEKLPADRFASATEFAAALAQPGYHFPAQHGMPGGVAAGAPADRLRRAVPWAAGALALLLGIALGARLLAPAAVLRPLRLAISIPSETPPLVLRISPDGSTLVYVSAQGDRLSIFARRLDELTPRRIEGTQDAYTVSFSPDGQSIAFLAGGGSPRKVPLSGGAPVVIPVNGNTPISSIEFAGPDRFIIATAGRLAILSADGNVTPFAEPDSTTNRSAWAVDQVLPNGWALTRYWRSPPNGPVVVIDPQTGKRITLVDVDATWAGYADGMLVWAVQAGTIFATPWTPGETPPLRPGQPLDAVALSVLGFQQPITIGAGGLAYVPTRPRAVIRATRRGQSTVLLATDRTYHNPRVSPSGRVISMDFTEQERDVWLYDIADSTLTRFGFDTTAHDAEWLPDGSGLLIAAVRRNTVGVFRRRFDASGAADSVFVGPEQLSIHAVTADLRTGIGVVIEGQAFDLVSLDLTSTAKLDTILATRYSEGWPALSPDGRWLAYASDEGGRFEVYLRAWPGLGSKVQVSQSGGGEPLWSRDGRELFYRSGGGVEPVLMAARIEAGRVVSRTPLFGIANIEFATPHRNYDVFPDGQSFVMVRQGLPGQQAEVAYLQNLPGLMVRR
jgi:serine/threonine-protein kinase